MKQRKRWIKWLLGILLTPFLLFVLLMIAVYVPSVQDVLRKEVVTRASEATGMDIAVGRIALRFPLNLLIRDVRVVNPNNNLSTPDTLLIMKSLNVRVQALPLLKKQVQVDGITLNDITLNSAHMIDGMVVKGELGRFYLRSHGIDLHQEAVTLNALELSDTELSVLMNDTTTTPAPEDTTTLSLPWRVLLKQIKLKNVAVQVQMPADTLRLSARIGEAALEDASADLSANSYAWQKFQLNDASVTYDSGTAPAIEGGLDPSHIALTDISLGIDSVRWKGKEINLLLRECALRERSGLSVSSLKGTLYADTTLIRVPNLTLRTPYSNVSLQALTSWKWVNALTAGNVDVRLKGSVGREDQLLLMGAMPEAFKAAYPKEPLTLEGKIQGNFRRMEIGGLKAELPGALTLNVNGELNNLTDSLKRAGDIQMEMQTGNMGFLTAAGDSTGSFVLPDSMHLTADLKLDGNQYNAEMKLLDGTGSMHLTGALHTGTQTYQATLAVKELDLHRFLPKDSLDVLSMNVTADGHGFDLNSTRTKMLVTADVERLNYGWWNLSGLKASADAQRDSTKIDVTLGDLMFRFRARSTIQALMERGTQFTSLLQEQINMRRLDHAALRRALPSAAMVMRAGKNNPVSKFLKTTQGVTYDDFTLLFGFSPRRGINGRSAMHGLRMDSLRIDTVFFAIHQDTSRMTLQGGVVNAPGNPQYVFRSTLTGEIRNEDAELTLKFIDGHGHTGLNLGLNARPIVDGGRRKRANGVAFKLTPEEPVIAFRKFHFIDDHNWIYLHQNMRVYANVEMNDEEDMGFRLQSVRGDSVSLQNMDVELQRFRLDEISRILPYMPKLSGLLSAEANYVQTEKTFQISAESNIEKFTYEGNLVGDLGAGATWLPGDNNAHYLNAYFTADGDEVISADAVMTNLNGRDSLTMSTQVQHFPMKLANAFIPNRMAELTGDVDGEITINGSTERPHILGQLALDSVSVYARQAGARYYFDNRPVRIENNKVVFDKFAIYTTSRNPFTIDGSIDFGKMEQPTANLTLLASNYTLLDAPRTRESLVYGKVAVDVRAMLRGALDALTMRGSMKVLSGTNVTYVMENSPLMVTDRLGELVTFTSFNAPPGSEKKEDVPTMSLGGMDMIMSLNIAETARLCADLSADRSSRIELQGGGTLNLQYTAQGDINLSGRYTLTGGMMKYQLPVFPLKEFEFSDGSYVNWTGDPMNPSLSLTAVSRVRASVSEEGNKNASRPVNFDVSLNIKDRLSAPQLAFDVDAPQDASVQNELETMGPEERGKQAVMLLATGIYLKSGAKGGGLSMGGALNSVLSSQINSLVGNLKNASINVGVDERNSGETGEKTTDYSFRYSQRFFNDRVQIIIGGKVSTGANATNSVESFIDNVSLEYRLDDSATRYIRAFRNKNYDSILDGEITETGVGLVLRRKVDRLGELFIFRRKKKADTVSEK
jgi:hypothetical protein